MANPPITIGELTDVPAPGSPIASAWAQEATQRIVHRFATSAARDAQYTGRPTGALAYSIDTKRLCMWDGTGWVILREAPTTVPNGSPILTNWPHAQNGAGTPIGVTGTWGSTTTTQAQYMRAAGLCHILVYVYLVGPTVSVGQINLPFDPSATAPIQDTGWWVNLYSSGVDVYPGYSEQIGASSTKVAIRGLGVVGSTIKRQQVTATFPFTWKAGDAVTVGGAYALQTPYDIHYANP